MAVPPSLLEPLLAMGLSRLRAERAVLCSGARTVDAALDWVFAHSDVADDALPAPPPPPPHAAVPQQQAPAAPPAAFDAEALRALLAAAAAPAPPAPAGGFDFGFGAVPDPVAALGGAGEEEEEDGDDLYKLTLAVRMDLGMSVGKIAAQCAHAAVGAFERVMMGASRGGAHATARLRGWDDSGHKKIVLKVRRRACCRAGAAARTRQRAFSVQCRDLAEFDAIERGARAAGLATYAVHDAGRTEVEPNTRTVLAIGPDRAALIDQVGRGRALFFFPLCSFPAGHRSPERSARSSIQAQPQRTSLQGAAAFACAAAGTGHGEVEEGAQAGAGCTGRASRRFNRTKCTSGRGPGARGGLGSCRHGSCIARRCCCSLAQW